MAHSCPAAQILTDLKIKLSFNDMKRGKLYLMAAITRLVFPLGIFIFFFNLSTTAQNEKWPIVTYGTHGGGYQEAPIIQGYLILTSKSLKGVMHRTMTTKLVLDTVVNSDTLFGRIKLHVLR